MNAFWSLTMYGLPDRLLVANPINRYLINSPMLPDFKRDPDDSLTLYIQHAPPGKDKESNWLPAPDGAFSTVPAQTGSGQRRMEATAASCAVKN